MIRKNASWTDESHLQALIHVKNYFFVNFFIQNLPHTPHAAEKSEQKWNILFVYKQMSEVAWSCRTTYQIYGVYGVITKM